MVVDSELLQTFREETGERLDRMVTTLLGLETDTADVELLATLFRDAHSIKGNAGMLGFGEAHTIAHAMEDVIHSADQNGTLGPSLIDPLLGATDAIRAVVGGSTGLAAAAVAGLQAAPEPLAGGAASASDRVNGAEEDDEPESDDLAAPAPRSIRVHAGKIDRLLDVVGETVLHRRRLDHLVSTGGLAGDDVEIELGHGELLLDELQRSVTQMRTLPLHTITSTYPRAVRDMAAAAGKQVSLTLAGTDTQLDRLMLDGISETIVHLVRNSVSHGIEVAAQRIAAGKPDVGRLELSAEARGEWVAISVRDDGAGVAPSLLALAAQRGSLAEVLAEAGMSTAAQVTELSGRGVGLDAVKRHVESLGGSLEVESETGRGTAVTLLLPLVLSVIRLLLIENQGFVYGVPLANTVEVAKVDRTLSLAGRRSLEVRGEAIPVCNVGEALGAGANENAGRAVIVSASKRRVALTCDEILDESEVVVKSLGPMLSGVEGYLGAAILPDARIALILDPAFVVSARGKPAAARRAVDRSQLAQAKVLVVDDQLTVRELERSILEAAGYGVVTAPDGRAAQQVLREDADIALVLTDIEMPHMDGFELLAAIRGGAERPTLPVVVVSSQGGERDRLRGAEAGADAYVVKSEFAQGGLLTIVGRLIGRG